MSGRCNVTIQSSGFFLKRIIIQFLELIQLSSGERMLAPYSGSEYMREIFGAVVMHENGILVSLAQTNVKSKFQMTKFIRI